MKVDRGQEAAVAIDRLEAFSRMSLKEKLNFHLNEIERLSEEKGRNTYWKRYYIRLQIQCIRVRLDEMKDG